MRYEYSLTGDLTGVEYPTGTTESFKYDGQHNLLVASGGGKVVRTLRYDSAGRLTAITDGNGNTSEISVDVPGLQQVFTSASGRLTTVETYDEAGNLVQQDRAAGGKTITTKATFDAAGRLLSSTDGLGRTTSQTYDGVGNVLTQTDARGHTTAYTYNAFGQPLTVTDRLGNVTKFIYDAKGNLKENEAPDGGKTSYTYDAAGALLTSTDPVGRVTTRAYDSTGQLASVTDPGGNTTHQTTDPESGRPSSITDSTGATTLNIYDTHGKLVRVNDAKGRSRILTYDALDRVTSMTDPMGATVEATYDAVGNLTSLTNRNGQTITYSYDADSRLVSKTVPGAGTTTYTYDGFGRLTALANPTARVVRTYDDADRVLTESTTPTTPGALPISAFTYTYDANGNITSVEGPGGATAYSYDSASRLTRVTPPAGGFHDFGYDRMGRQTSLTRPNGVNDTTTYDPAGNLTSLHSTLGGTLVNQADYTYNAAGLRATLTSTAGTASFGYDAASRLTSATYTGTGLPNEQYTYDSLGNRTSTANAPLGSFTYDNASKLLADGTATYEYDREGNLLKRTVTATGATTSYAWNAEHQLVGITRPDSSTTTFRYDPAGRRVEIDHGASATRYAYDGEAVAAEYDAANALAATYVRHPRSFTRALEMTRGGERFFYLTDALGSTTALTTMTGATANTYTYDAFGTAAQTGSVENPFTFTGQPSDRTAGVTLFPLRAYLPFLGRFLSEDPIPAINPYSYVSNNPTNFRDPSGAGQIVDLIVLVVRVALPVVGFTMSYREYRAGRYCHALTYFMGGLFGVGGLAASALALGTPTVLLAYAGAGGITAGGRLAFCDWAQNNRG